MELLKLCLQPGKIFLNRHGKPDVTVHRERTSLGKRYPKPDLSILLALSTDHLPLAFKLLYQGNTFVMPPGDVSSDFFERWHREDLQILPFVELSITRGDLAIYQYQPSKSRPNPASANFDIRRSYTIRGEPCHTYRAWLYDTWRFKQFCIQDLYKGRPIGDDLNERETRLKKMPLEDVPLGPHEVYAPRKSLWWLGLPSSHPVRWRGQVVSFADESKKNLAEYLVQKGNFARCFTQAEYDCLDSMLNGS